MVVDYDPRWPEHYAAERATLSKIVEGVVDIQHIGSSAVPGLAAKDRVDILVGCDALRHLSDYHYPLADAGYELVTGMNVAASDHLFVKVENDHVGGSSASSLGAYPGRDYNEIKAAVVVGF